MVVTAPTLPAKQNAVRLAVLGGVVVFFIKLLGYKLTGSVGVLSDALESTVNVAAAAITAWAISVAAQPPDEDHPYGHDKAEYLSATIEGVLIGVAAVVIINSAIVRLAQPQTLQSPALGLVITAIASAINFALGHYLIRSGHQLHSPALVADGKHVLSDVTTSLGVLLGVAVAASTGLYWLDPLIALLVAVNILFVGVRIVRNSVRGLMDTAFDESELSRLRNALAPFHQRYSEIHDLRTRVSGARHFIDFHMVVAGDLSVQAAHNLCDQLEDAICTEFSDASVTIHVEPTGFERSAPDLRF